MATQTSCNAKKLLNCLYQLRGLADDTQIIPLKNGTNIVGRTKETGIRDLKCSKRQLELKVSDENEPGIKLKVLGVNPCGVNGLMVMPKMECDLKNGDILEIVYGRHSYEVLMISQKNEHIPEEVKDKLDVRNKDGWSSVNNGDVLVFTSSNVKASTKIAAYDLDGTIIKTKSGLVFPKTCDDWTLNFDIIPKKLKQLHEDGYKICIFTNQAGIGKGKVDVQDFKQKIESIIDRLRVPVQVFAALKNDFYRKPCPGMWEYLENVANEGLKINTNDCFFVGDAAGRPEIGKGVAKRRKDHSLADRFFAKNINVKFYTPEEHFLNGKREEWISPEFDPSDNFESLSLLEPHNAKLSTNVNELIIMVGLPGSGKSHFSQHHLRPLGYTILNADTLGSVQACLQKCKECLSCGKACAIDNTNVDIPSRKKFLELAQKYNVPSRCFIMNVTEAQIKHNLAYRQLTDSKHTKINEMILNALKKKYMAPSVDEGFTEIVKVNLKPYFQNDEWKRLYKLCLLEKY